MVCGELGEETGSQFLTPPMVNLQFSSLKVQDTRIWQCWLRTARLTLAFSKLLFNTGKIVGGLCALGYLQKVSNKNVSGADTWTCLP